MKLVVFLGMTQTAMRWESYFHPQRAIQAELPAGYLTVSGLYCIYFVLLFNICY